MKTFEVLRTVDAYVRYIAEVEAETPEEATRIAQEKEEALTWEEESVSTYDARDFVTLDSKSGEEIEETRRGDL